MKHQTIYYLFLQEQNGDFWTYSSPNEGFNILNEVTLPVKQRNLLCHKAANYMIVENAGLCVF